MPDDKSEAASWLLRDLPLDLPYVGAICVKGDACKIAFRDYEDLFG